MLTHVTRRVNPGEALLRDPQLLDCPFSSRRVSRRLSRLVRGVPGGTDPPRIQSRLQAAGDGRSIAGRISPGSGVSAERFAGNGRLSPVDAAAAFGT